VFNMTTNKKNIREEINMSQQRFNSVQWESFFKYFSDDHRVIDNIFTKHLIRFTQPRALNDPLEFSPTIRFRENQLNYQYYKLNRLLLPSVETFTRVQLIESQINSYGILSLTKRPNSFNMWSQYSNGHRGFVIELKPDFNSFGGMKSSSGKTYDVQRVNYVDEYSIRIEDMVDKDGFIQVKTLLDELFFKKTSRWKHEYEYRMVRPLSDSSDYQPPKTNYVYTDTGIYLFPFDVRCISSIILGASMTQENKARILDFSEKNNIVLNQAHIIRDIHDSDGQPGSVIILKVDDDNREAILNSKPQLFCTDTDCLENRDTVEIRTLSDLPYYKDHEATVEELFKNLQNSP